MNYDQMNDCFYTTKDMPIHIKGLCYTDGNDFFVIINSKLSCNRAKEVYRHELLHKKRNDLQSDLERNVLEDECEEELMAQAQ